MELRSEISMCSSLEIDIELENFAKLKIPTGKEVVRWLATIIQVDYVDLVTAARKTSEELNTIWLDVCVPLASINTVKKRITRAYQDYAYLRKWLNDERH